MTPNAPPLTTTITDDELLSLIHDHSKPGENHSIAELAMAHRTLLAERDDWKKRAEAAERELYVCDGCAFTFHAQHTNADGTISCPVCEIAGINTDRDRLARENERLEMQLAESIAESNKRWEQLGGGEVERLARENAELRKERDEPATTLVNIDHFKRMKAERDVARAELTEAKADRIILEARWEKAKTEVERLHGLFVDAESRAAKSVTEVERLKAQVAMLREAGARTVRNVRDYEPFHEIDVLVNALAATADSGWLEEKLAEARREQAETDFEGLMDLIRGEERLPPPKEVEAAFAARDAKVQAEALRDAARHFREVPHHVIAPDGDLVSFGHVAADALDARAAELERQASDGGGA